MAIRNSLLVDCNFAFWLFCRCGGDCTAKVRRCPPRPLIKPNQIIYTRRSVNLTPLTVQRSKWCAALTWRWIARAPPYKKLVWNKWNFLARLVVIIFSILDHINPTGERFSCVFCIQHTASKNVRAWERKLSVGCGFFATHHVETQTDACFGKCATRNSTNTAPVFGCHCRTNSSPNCRSNRHDIFMPIPGTEYILNTMQSICQNWHKWWLNQNDAATTLFLWTLHSKGNNHVKCENTSNSVDLCWYIDNFAPNVTTNAATFPNKTARNTK